MAKHPRQTITRWVIASQNRSAWSMNWLRPVRSILERQDLDNKERRARMDAKPILMERGLL